MQSALPGEGLVSLATTTLLGSTEFISQGQFAAIIRAPGVRDKEVNEVFSFRKPRQRFDRTNASSLLNLSLKQHDILYALSGCIDVLSVMSRIRDEVRQVVEDVYGVDKLSLRIWFKNRGGAWRIPQRQAKQTKRKQSDDCTETPHKIKHACYEGDIQEGCSTSSDQSNHDFADRGHGKATDLDSSHFASTKLLGSEDVITQDIFASVISCPGASLKDVTELFSFRRPKQSSIRTNASALLNLSPKQHDVLYALCGCSDVVSIASLVKQEVRDLVCDIFSIQQASLSTWFKNRRQVTRKALVTPSDRPEPAFFGSSKLELQVVDGAHVVDLPKPVTNGVGTKLIGGNDVITQAIFMLIIKSPGVSSRNLSELFTFSRHFMKQYKIFPNISKEHHDVLFALGGCSDVKYKLSNISQQARSAVVEVYGLDEVMLEIWYRCISEMQAISADMARRYAAPAITNSPPHPISKFESEQKTESLAIIPDIQVAAHQQPISTFMFNGCTYALPSSSRVDGAQNYVIMPGGMDGYSSLPSSVLPSQIQWARQSDGQGQGGLPNSMLMALSKATNDVVPLKASDVRSYEGPSGQRSCLSQLANQLRGFAASSLPSSKGLPH